MALVDWRADDAKAGLYRAIGCAAVAAYRIAIVTCFVALNDSVTAYYQAA
jgi:hypothetical protein